ncbi:MAG TPA: protein translocase subunit SecF [Actinomycetota bacterium]|jgi:preprotein translocase subunit SecF
MNWHHAIETYRGHTIPHFRFIEHRRWWFTISGVLIVLSILGFAVRGLNLSIDFEGGAQISYTWETPVSVGDVTAVLADNGHPDANVQIANGDTILIRTDSLTGDPEASAALLDALATQAGIDRSEINVQDVGPTWGEEISRKALTGLIVVLLAITLYITVRFEWKMAIGAMIALVHDVVITAGVYALTGREVTPETVIAILTILGFSLYDTVVIYDKIQENTESTALVAREGYANVVNLSLNQVFMRSVNTSLVVLLPILSLLLFGGDTLKDFAFAMFIGVATGAYSSIFIAAPFLTILKAREAKYRQLEARRTVRETKAGGRPVAAPAEPTAPEDATEEVAVAATAPARTATRPSGAARPRPKSKRRPPAKRRRR